MATIPIMKTPAKAQVTLTEQDRDALDALMVELPHLEEAGAASLIRTLMRLGLASFAHAPLTAMRTTEPPATAWIVARIRAALVREQTVEREAPCASPAPPATTPPAESEAETKSRLRSEIDSDVTPRSLSAVRSELDRMRKKKRSGSGPQPKQGPPSKG